MCSRSSVCVRCIELGRFLGAVFWGVLLLRMSGSEKISSSVREVDPLLKDLSEKKLNFQRNVIALVADLEGVRGLLASQEESLARETQNRQA